MQPDEIASLFIADIEPWYESKRNASKGVNTNVMTVGLVMTDHMEKAFPLVESDYLTSSQVKGLGGARIKRILQCHGEGRKFTSEGGRTSRGTVDLARQLADVLNRSAASRIYLESSSLTQAEVRRLLQLWFVRRVARDFFDQQRIEANELDPNKPVRRAIAELIQAARLRGGTVAGAVAQHLVGTTLSLRFPAIEVSNERYTTADQQTDRPGDFLVGDTAFHVTLSPSDHLMSHRCASNIQHGYRVLVLVPEGSVVAGWQLARNTDIGDRIAISGIEEFVGDSIEELATYSTPQIRRSLRLLLERYNERVRAAEPDPSFQIEIPGNL